MIGSRREFDPDNWNQPQWWEQRQVKVISAWALALIFLLLVASMLARLTQDQPEEAYPLTSINSFTLQLLLRHSTEPFTLITLYDHDCSSCGSQIAQMAEYEQQFKNAGVKLVPISMADEPAQAGMYLFKHNVPTSFKTYIVSPSEKQELRNQFYHFGNRQIMGYPHTMLLNRNHRIIQEFTRAASAEDILNIVKEAKYAP